MKNPQRINLNTADAKLMASSLHGIGQGLAEDIVKLRDNIAETQGRDIELENLEMKDYNNCLLLMYHCIISTSLIQLKSKKWAKER